jgi:hypothetical protein
MKIYHSDVTETHFVSDTAAALLDAVRKEKEKLSTNSEMSMSISIGDTRFVIGREELEAILRKAI